MRILLFPFQVVPFLKQPSRGKGLSWWSETGRFLWTPFATRIFCGKNVPIQPFWVHWEWFYCLDLCRFVKNRIFSGQARVHKELNFLSPIEHNLKIILRCLKLRFGSIVLFNKRNDFISDPHTSDINIPVITKNINNQLISG